MKTNILTLFDKNYAIRAVAFYNALSKLGDYTFWFLCLDKETKEMMNKLSLPNVRIITLADMNDQELMATETKRNVSEFVFTAKSAFASHVAKELPNGDALILLDNDVIFFLPPDELIERMRVGGYSIGINPHRFTKNAELMTERVGRYNAGFLCFIMDQKSRLCISDWRKDCIDWCFLIYEKKRFGDQKYINYWPKRYSGVYEILDKGINLASWNIFSWKITRRGGRFFVDGDPLVCYHFHRLKFYTNGGEVWPVPIFIYHRELYRIYTTMVQSAWDKTRTEQSNWCHGLVEKPNIFRLWKQKLQIRYVRRIN